MIESIRDRLKNLTTSSHHAAESPHSSPPASLPASTTVSRTPSFTGVEQQLEQMIEAGKDPKSSLKAILDKGDPAALATNEQKLVFHAAKRGHDDVMKALLARTSIKPDVKDDKERTPLSYASEYGHEDVVALLLKRKDVDAHSHDKLQRTPLSYAAQDGHKPTVKLLLERDTQLANKADIYGMPPLYYATVGGRSDAMNTLLKHTTIMPGASVKPGWCLHHPEGSHRRVSVEPSHALKGHPRAVITSVCFAWNGSWVALGSDRTVDVFESASGSSMRTFNFHPVQEGAAAKKSSFIRALTSVPGHPWVAGGSDDGSIQLWDVIKGSRVRAFVAHSGHVRALKAAKNGIDLLSGAEDKTVKHWDATTGALKHTWTAPHGITALAISPSGRFVAAGTSANITLVWDLQTRELIAELGQASKHHHYISALAFIGDNDYHLSTTSNDKVIHKWELAQHGSQHHSEHGSKSPKRASCVFKIDGHKGPVWNVAAAQNGQWLITSSQDRSLRVWDAKNGDLQFSLYGHTGQVPHIAVSPANDLFISVGDKGIGKLWKLKKAE